MCIILPKREELKQPPTNPFGCQNPQQPFQNNINMVTPPKNHPSSKVGQGGGVGGNKRSQHQNSHHIKRNQNNKAPTTPAAVQLHTSTVTQKGRQNHQRSRQINNSHTQQQHSRSSPNPTNTSDQHRIQQQQQRHNNRQTPPRNVTNHVNMNNGQPSLVELITTTTPTTNPAQKNVVTPHKHSQKTFQDSSFRTPKGHTITNNGSRSSPILTNLSKSNRSSPQGFAGSKCFEPPTPNSLPKPPSDWTPFQIPSKQILFGNVGNLTFDDMAEANSYLDNHFLVSSTARDVSQELKLILNVSA